MPHRSIAESALWKLRGSSEAVAKRRPRPGGRGDLARGSIGCTRGATDAAESFQADLQAKPLDRLDAPDLNDAAGRPVAGILAGSRRDLSFSSLPGDNARKRRTPDGTAQLSVPAANRASTRPPASNSTGTARRPAPADRQSPASPPYPTRACRHPRHGANPRPYRPHPAEAAIPRHATRTGGRWPPPPQGLSRPLDPGPQTAKQLRTIRLRRRRNAQACLKPPFHGLCTLRHGREVWSYSSAAHAGARPRCPQRAALGGHRPWTLKLARSPASPRGSCRS